MKVTSKSLFFLVTLYFSVTAGQAVGAVAEGVDPEADPPEPAFPEQTDAPQPGYQVEVLTSGLALPRSLEVLPGGDLIVTEGVGDVMILGLDGTLSEPLSGMPAVRSVNGRGFQDFVLDTNFSANRRVFFTYAAPPEGEPGGPRTEEERRRAEQRGEVFQVGQVAYATLSEDNSTLENVEVIAQIPGRRLVSAPDSTLYITTQGHGDLRPQVQKLTNFAGKVLRVNPDGSIPADNPYADRSMLQREIFSWGHRDPDGMFVHPETGELWSVEHGPMGGDELNIIRPGSNYGWPVITYGKNYDGTEIGPTARTHMEQPRYFWYPSIAPSGAMMYTGDMFEQWQGNVFIGALSRDYGRFLVRLVMDGDTVVGEQHLLVNRNRRVRDVAQGIDGAIYVLTDSTQGQEDGEVLRITPSPM